MSGQGGRIRHVAALDGLRGAAVAAVLLFHGGHLTGGYLGVDLFFVLSGFLITSLLLAEGGASGGVRLGSFWARRARRLLPALFGMLLAVALYCLLLAPASEVAQIRGDAISTIAYVANWRAVFANRNYFALFQSPSPLEHTWSLAIEEQFYLVWPLVFVGLLAWRRDAIARSVLVTAAIGSTVSAVLMVVLYNATDPSRSYYGTDTRATGILLGAGLAALLSMRGPLQSDRARRVLDGLGLAGIAVLAFTWTQLAGSSSKLYHGGFLLSELAAVAIIAAAVQPRAGPVTRIFSWKPLCALGLISYGVYLWHWPVDVVLNADRTGIDGWPLFFFQCAVTLGIALVSYFMLEMPIRRGAGTRATWIVAVPSAIAVIALVFVVLQPRIDASAASNVDVGAAAATNRSRAGLVKQRAALSAGAGATSRPWVLVVGDSVSYSLSVGAPEGATAPFTVAAAPIFGCGIIGGVPTVAPPFASPAKCASWPSLWQRAASVFHPSLIVLFPGPWDLMDRKFDGRALPMYSSGLRARFNAHLEQAARIAAGAKSQLVLLSTTCFDFSARTFGKEASEPRRVRWTNDIYEKFAREHPATVHYVDIHSYLCPAGAPSAQLDGKDITSDGVHLSLSGSREVWGWLAPRLTALLPAPTIPPAGTTPRPQAP